MIIVCMSFSLLSLPLSLSLSLSVCLCVRRDCPQPSREDAPRNIAMQAEWPNGQPEKGGSPLAALAIYLSYPFMCAFFHVCVLLSLSLSLLLCLYCLQPDFCLIIFFTTLLRFCYMIYFFIYHCGLAVLAVEPLNCRHGRGKDLRPLMLMAPHAQWIPIGNDSNWFKSHTDTVTSATSSCGAQRQSRAALKLRSGLWQDLRGVWLAWADCIEGSWSWWSSKWAWFFETTSHSKGDSYAVMLVMLVEGSPKGCRRWGFQRIASASWSKPQNCSGQGL